MDIKTVSALVVRWEVQRLLHFNTECTESDLMHWQQRGKTSPYKGNLHSAVIIGTVCAFTEPENTAKYHSTKPVPLIKCLFIQLQLKHELCFNSTA